MPGLQLRLSPCRAGGLPVGMPLPAPLPCSASPARGGRDTAAAAITRPWGALDTRFLSHRQRFTRYCFHNTASSQGLLWHMHMLALHLPKARPPPSQHPATSACCSGRGRGSAGQRTVVEQVHRSASHPSLPAGTRPLVKPSCFPSAAYWTGVTGGGRLSQP